MNTDSTGIYLILVHDILYAICCIEYLVSNYMYAIEAESDRISLQHYKIFKAVSIFCVKHRFTTYMGWLRLVGSFKLWISFAEYSLFYRALLLKRPIISRSLLIEATPYAIEVVSD